MRRGALILFLAAGPGCVCTAQDVTVSAVAPASVSPGEVYAVQVVAAVAGLPGGAVAGFGLDAVNVSGAGAVAGVSTASFGSLSLATRPGQVSGASLVGVVGGQMPNLLGINPGIDLGNPIVLFTFEVTTEAAAGGETITFRPDNPNIHGGVVLYPDAAQGASVRVPNDAGTSIAFVSASTVVEAPCIADWTGDGNVNTADFVGYLNDYNAVAGGGSYVFADPDLAAPFGVLNTADFVAFLNAFVAGC